MFIRFGACLSKWKWMIQMRWFVNADGSHTRQHHRVKLRLAVELRPDVSYRRRDESKTTSRGAGGGRCAGFELGRLLFGREPATKSYHLHLHIELYGTGTSYMHSLWHGSRFQQGRRSLMQRVEGVEVGSGFFGGHYPDVAQKAGSHIRAPTNASGLNG